MEKLIQKILWHIYSDARIKMIELSYDPPEFDLSRKCPLAHAIRAVIEAYRGKKVNGVNLYETAKDICDILFLPVAGVDYQIPKEFWKTELGKAIKFALKGERKLSSNEVAKILECEPEKVDKLVASGELRAKEVKGRYIFRDTDVDSYHRKKLLSIFFSE